MKEHMEHKPAVESDAAMKIILEASPVGIVVFDQDARVLYTNPLADTIFGIKPDRAANMRCGDFIRCANRSISLQGCGHSKRCQVCPLFGAICDACSQKTVTEPIQGETFLDRSPDLPGIWVKYRVVGMVINGANATVMAVDDITARKKDEEKMHNLMVELSAIYEHAPIAMMLLDRDRRVKKANGFAARFADRTPAEMTGLMSGEALRCVHHLDDPKGCGFGPACARCHVRQAVLDTFETGGSQTDVEAWLPFPRGDSIEERCLLISTAFLQISGTERVLVCAQDITERKKAREEKEKLQAQLTQAQKMESVGRLAGGVAHDFNNMLGVILGHVELALLQTDEHHDLYSDLKAIQTAATRSADLTKQLLAFARKQTISPRQLDLNDTVESLLTMLRRLIGEDIDLVWQPAPDLWPVKMDPTQIDQILANLCVNARDAIAGVGKLTIETGKKTFDYVYCKEHPGFVPGDFVLLAVSDSGCGMDKDTLGKLFEPFFTTKEVGKGTGLGLATIYGIVKQNNGFINVYSEPGQGSTFRIYLPRHRAENEADMAVPETKAAAGGTETILLVEDEPAILRMTRMMLERKGYTVISAGTPAQALEKAQNHAGAIDLLMSDVVMPEMNGRNLAAKITALYPDIRLLFMSGYTANVIAHQGILDKGVAFIQKPFSMAELTEKVRQVMDHVK